jgi:hypothetical protein
MGKKRGVIGEENVDGLLKCDLLGDDLFVIFVIVSSVYFYPTLTQFFAS